MSSVIWWRVFLSLPQKQLKSLLILGSLSAKGLFVLTITQQWWSVNGRCQMLIKFQQWTTQATLKFVGRLGEKAQFEHTNRCKLNTTIPFLKFRGGTTAFTCFYPWLISIIIHFLTAWQCGLRDYHAFKRSQMLQPLSIFLVQVS